MDQPDRICIQIKWRCRVCGHRHKDNLALEVPVSRQRLPDAESVCSLVCDKCGRERTVQITLGELSNTSGREILVARLEYKATRTRRWAGLLRAAQFPSKN